MSSKPRNIIPKNFYHIYNRGASKQKIFHADNDYRYFLEKTLFYRDKFKIKILAYCILPNHWHFLLQEPDDPTGQASNISVFISTLSNSYTKYYNFTKSHSGRIFEGPFKSKHVNSDNYLYVLVNYINLNHVKHKISNKDEWDYTSYNEYSYKTHTGLIEGHLVDFKVSIDDISCLKNINEEF